MVYYVSGPTSLSIWTYNNRRFYMFGDYHFSLKGSCQDMYGVKCDSPNKSTKIIEFNNSQCIDIVALLEIWFYYNNKYKIRTDFYVETEFSKIPYVVPYNTEEESTGMLDYIGNYYYDCLTMDKSECRHKPYIRFHYSDPRHVKYPNYKLYSDFYYSYIFYEITLQPFFSNVVSYVNNTQANSPGYEDNMNLYINNTILYGNSIIDLISKLFETNLLLHYFEVNDIEQIVKNIRGELNTLKTINNAILIAYNILLREILDTAVIRDGIKLHRTTAEYARLQQKNPIFAKHIKDFYLSKLETETQILKEKLQYYRKELNSYTNENLILHFTFVRDVVNNIISDVIPMTGFNMDIYTFSRIGIYDDSSNVILISGENHARHNAEFMEYIGAQNIFRTSTDVEISHMSEVSLAKRCIDITNPDVPIPVNNYSNNYINDH